MKRLLIILAVFSANLAAQGQPVNMVLNPPPANWTYLYWCGSGMTTCGTGNTQVSAICMAPAQVAPTVYVIANAPTITNIVVAANVGTITLGTTAQFWVGQIVTASGSTTAALNASYRINTVSGSTATITTVGVGDATYNNAALTLTTSGPVLNALIWAIQLFPFTNSSVNASYYAGGGTQITQGLACSNRTAY